MENDRGSVRLYDGRGGVQATDLADRRIRRRDEGQLLWIDLVSADAGELEQAADAVGLDGEALRRLLEADEDGLVDDQGDTIGVHVHSLERTDEGYEPQRLNLAAGGTWVITAHESDNRTIDEFQRRLETSRRVGALDGGSFVAFLLDWLFTAYMATIGAIDQEIDDLDVSILHSSGDGPSLERIADLRRRVARIRRALSEHRELVSWPAHTEFSEVMTESAQRHFAAVGERFEQAMGAADVTRDALSGSFDLLMSRVAQRTNDTVRILTVVSVSLLPAALLAGVMGMNFHPSFFDHPEYFWLTVVAIAVVVVVVLITARRRRWV
jgi:Mg2+ and Co2+ transporter CorA